MTRGPRMINATSGASKEGEAVGAPDARHNPVEALVVAVHHGDQLTIRRILDRPDLPRIAVDLALRVPLLTRRHRSPCGTRAAAERHLAHGEVLDIACLEARRAYFRNRQRRVRAQGREEDPKTRAKRRRRVQAIDQVAIDRYVNGDLTVPLLREEKKAALVLLVKKGYTISAAGSLLGLNGTYTRRYADEAGISVPHGRDDAHMTQTSREDVA